MALGMVGRRGRLVATAAIQSAVCMVKKASWTACRLYFCNISVMTVMVAIIVL